MGASGTSHPGNTPVWKVETKVQRGDRFQSSTHSSLEWQSQTGDPGLFAQASGLAVVSSEVSHKGV